MELKLLVVQHGFGSLLPYLVAQTSTEDNNNHAILQQQYTNIVRVPEIPEPVDDRQKALDLLTKEIKEWHPDVLLACSRGAELASSLVNESGAWSGPTLILSGMCKTNVWKEFVPVIFVHGIHDTTIPIQSVRMLAQTGTPGLVRLIELEDDHHLGYLRNNDNKTETKLQSLVAEVFQLGKRVATAAAVTTATPTSTQKSSAIESGFARNDMFSKIRSRRKD